MNLAEFQKQFNNTLLNVLEDGNDPKDTEVSIQIEIKEKPEAIFATDIEIKYDDYGAVSGVVILGYEEK